MDRQYNSYQPSLAICAQAILTTKIEWQPSSGAMLSESEDIITNEEGQTGDTSVILDHRAAEMLKKLAKRAYVEKIDFLWRRILDFITAGHTTQCHYHFRTQGTIACHP